MKYKQRLIPKAAFAFSKSSCYWWCFAILFFLVQCAQERQKNHRELRNEILSQPLLGKVDSYEEGKSSIQGFQHEDGSYEYFFIDQFNEEFSNGFFGPVTSEYVFDQMITLDIQSEGSWKIINQTAFPGRLVQNSQKGPFKVSQTLFFPDSLISVSIFSIVNSSSENQELKASWTYRLHEDLRLQKRKGYGGRFLSQNGEYWPHTSGEDIVTFQEDSTRIKKNVHSIPLVPQEETKLYWLIYIDEGLDTILPSRRSKPWLYFPEEELIKNIEYWGKKIQLDESTFSDD
ncbi:MAG: hypothetical protein AAF487_00310 [Bacteroidota bacterium]